MKERCSLCADTNCRIKGLFWVKTEQVGKENETTTYKLGKIEDCELRKRTEEVDLTSHLGEELL